jgi:hypothetical protein
MYIVEEEDVNGNAEYWIYNKDGKRVAMLDENFTKI